jgi:hypothetical protein
MLFGDRKWMEVDSESREEFVNRIRSAQMTEAVEGALCVGFGQDWHRHGGISRRGGMLTIEFSDRYRVSPA